MHIAELVTVRHRGLRFRRHYLVIKVKHTLFLNTPLRFGYCKLVSGGLPTILWKPLSSSYRGVASQKLSTHLFSSHRDIAVYMPSDRQRYKTIRFAYGELAVKRNAALSEPLPFRNSTRYLFMAVSASWNRVQCCPDWVCESSYPV